MKEFLPRSKKEALQIIAGSIVGVCIITGFAWGIMAIGYMLGVE